MIPAGPEYLDLARLALVFGADRAGQHQIDLRSEHCVERWCRALEGNVKQFDPGGFLQRDEPDVRSTALAPRRIGEFAGLLPGCVHQFTKVAIGQGVALDQHKVDGAHQRDRHEAIECVIGKGLVDVRIDRVCVGGAEEQRVAVGRRLGDVGRPDCAARPRPVLDRDRLAHPLSQSLRYDARCRVRR